MIASVSSLKTARENGIHFVLAGLILRPAHSADPKRFSSIVGPAAVGYGASFLNTMLNQLIRPASLPAYLPSFFTRPLFQPTGLPAANLPTQIIAAPKLHWWEWRRWLVEAVANRHQPSGDRRLKPMRQTAIRHPVGSFLAICTSAGLHRTHADNQPLLRIDFLSHADWVQRGTGRISVHFTGPFTINHEVWWFLEGWSGWRFTAAQKRRGVDCATLVHRGAALEVGRVFYPAGGTAACIHRALPCSESMASHLRYRLLHRAS